MIFKSIIYGRSENSVFEKQLKKDSNTVQEKFNCVDVHLAGLCNLVVSMRSFNRFRKPIYKKMTVMDG